MRMAFTIAMFIILSYTSVEAGTDVGQSLETLKTNMENSQTNFDQYEKNQKISARNAEETRKAMVELKKLEKSLIENSQNIDKNKAKLDQMKVKIQEYKKAEMMELEKEKNYIAEVQALLNKLQKNAQQREMNITAYDTKMQEIDKEKKDWDTQRGALADLKQEIASKYTQAQQENAKWSGKEKSYGDESTKWRKQSITARETYLQYKHLHEK